MADDNQTPVEYANGQDLSRRERVIGKFEGYFTWSRTQIATLKAENERLHTENEYHREEIERLQGEITRMNTMQETSSRATTKLTQDNKKLNITTASLSHTLAYMERENARLETANDGLAHLVDENITLTRENITLHDTIAADTERHERIVSDLTRQVKVLQTPPPSRPSRIPVRSMYNNSPASPTRPSTYTSTVLPDDPFTMTDSSDTSVPRNPPSSSPFRVPSVVSSFRSDAASVTSTTPSPAAVLCRTANGVPVHLLLADGTLWYGSPNLEHLRAVAAKRGILQELCSNVGDRYLSNPD